jgi:threonine dehydratase
MQIANPLELVTRQRITETAALICPYIRRTPVIEVDAADFGLPSARISFKLELLQHTGSFKPRGAFTNLLTREIPVAGIVAASGGNHGVAVAYAAKKLGKRATIFVPKVASQSKIDRIRAYGADYIVTGERYADALAASEKWREETGAMPVHAYDNIETLFGQGTVGLEMEEQAPDLTTLLVAVGGGGLIGGIAAWYADRIKIIGVEPELAPTLWNALQAGHPVDSAAGGVAADSLAPRQVGQLMFPIAQRYANKVVLVKDEEILRAQQALWDVLRIAAEPGGATAFSALLSRRYVPQPGEHVGVVICGGNTTAVNFAKH